LVNLDEGQSRTMSDEITIPPVSESGEPTPISPPAYVGLVPKLAAEAIGTFILIVFGVGTAVTSGGDIAAIGLAFGVAIIIGVYAFGRLSGGHFNPAVTMGAAISGRMPWVEAGFYALAQLVGAIVGAFAVWVFMRGIPGYHSTVDGLGQNHYGVFQGHVGIAWWAAFLLELTLTMIFVFVILGLTDVRNEYVAFVPLAVGLTLAGIHFFAIPLTGTGVNPARSIGPALFAGGHAIGQLWLFILAPLIGGALAGIAYPALFGRTEEPVAGSGFKLPQTMPRPAGSRTQTVPTWQQPVAPAAEGELPVYEQDGWRWDYPSQQWKPIEEPPAPPTAVDDTTTTRIVPPEDDR
jgi:aquaporin Z